MTTAVKVRTLVVDDHAGCRKALGELVEAAGFELVDTADSGESACAAVAACRPDLVLLDVRMPGMGGRAAAAAIAALHPETIVVLVSETPDESGAVVPKSTLTAGVLRGLWRVRSRTRRHAGHLPATR